MASAQDSGAWKEVVQKNDEELASLEQEDRALAALEADLQAAEERYDLAEWRHGLATRRVAQELAKPLLEGPVRNGSGSQEEKDPSPAAEQAADSAEQQGHTQKGTRDTKNAGARTDKEVSRDRWLSQRASEGRVREAHKRARERLRRGRRDAKQQAAGGDGLEVAAAEASLAAPAAGTEPAAQGDKPQSRELGPGESAAAAEGAEGIAERLKSVGDRPDGEEKRHAFIKVVTAGRDNYYCFEPAEVLGDLTQRGLLDASSAAKLTGLLDESRQAAKEAGVPQEKWLEHAQKIAGMERLDDKPFREAEALYLKLVDEKALAKAEAELEAAERQLQKLVREVEARYPQAVGEPTSPTTSPKAAPSAGTSEEVVQDIADRLESQHEAQRESRGSKNTSALSEKAVSCQRWVAARESEDRDREKEKMAREARRSEARDLKHGAGDVQDDQ